MPRSVEPSLPMSVRKISPTRAVLVHAGGDVALVAADRELVRDRLALARHPLAARAGLGERLADGLLDDRVDVGRRRRALLRVGAQRLRGLRAVAVDRQRLDPQAPGLRCRRRRCPRPSPPAGRLTVFEIAPEMNGCTAPIILMWPMCEIARSPTATSNTGRCSSFEARARRRSCRARRGAPRSARSAARSSRASAAPAARCG